MILCLTPLAISFINLIDVVLTGGVDSCPTDGIHPSLDSCTIYTRCFQGFPFHFHCGKREVFDVESKSCVKFKQLQNCYKFDCAKNHKYAVYEGDPSYYSLCDKGKAIAIKLCKEGLIFDESKQTCVFKCQQAGIVQHPFDCTMYIECPYNFFKNFWIKRRCPPRSWFHPTEKVCTINEIEKCAAAKNHISIHNTQQFTLRPEKWRKKKKNDIQEVSIEQNDSVQINNELLKLGENTQELSVSKATKHYRLNKGSSTTENNVNVIEDSSTDYYLKSAEYTTPKTDETSTTYQTKHHDPSDLIDSGTNFYRHTTDTNSGSVINYKQNYYSSTLSIILRPDNKSNNALSTPDDLKMKVEIPEESGNFNTEITSEINGETVNFSSSTVDSLVVSTKPATVTDESTYSPNFRTTELKRNEKSAKNKQTTNFDRKELSDLPSTNYPEHTSYMTDSDYNLEQTQHYDTSTLNIKHTNEKGSKNKYTTNFDSSELTDSATPHYHQHSTVTSNGGSNLYYTNNYDTFTLNTLKPPNDKTSGSSTIVSLPVPTNDDISKVTDRSTVSQFFRTTETNEESSKSSIFNQTELPEKPSTNSLATDVSNDGSTKNYIQNYYPSTTNSTLPPNIKTNNGSSTTETLTVSTTEDVVKVTDKSAVSHSFSTSVPTIPKRNEETSKTTKTATFNQNELPESTNYHSHSTETNNDGSTMEYTKNYYTSTLNSTLPPNDKSNNSSSAKESLSVSTTEDIHKVTYGSTILYTFTTEQTIQQQNEASSTTTFDQNELSESTSTNYYLHSTVATNSGSTSDYTQSKDASIVNSKLQPNSETNNSSSTTESLEILSTLKDDGKATNKSTVSHTNAEYTTPEKNMESTTIVETSSSHQNELTDSPSTNYPPDGANKNNGDSLTDSTQNFNMSTLNSTLSPNDKSNNSSSAMESLAESTTEDVNKVKENTVSYTYASTENTTPKTNEEISTEPQSSNGDSLTDSMQNYSTSTFQVTSPQKDRHGNDTSSTESLALPTKEDDGKATDKSTVSYTFGSTEHTTHGKNTENSNNGDSTTDSTKNINLSTLTSLLPPNDKSNCSNCSSNPEYLTMSTTERVTNESTVSYTYATIENATPKTNEEISTEPQSSNGDSTTDSMQNYFTSTVDVTSPPKDLPSNDTTSTESLALPTKEDDGKAADKSTVSYTFRSTEHTTNGKNKENSVTTETTFFHQNELSETPSTPSLNYPSDGVNTNYGDSTTDSTQKNNLFTVNSTISPNDKSNNSSSTLESLAVSTTEKVTNESSVSYTYATIENATPKTNEEISTEPHTINASNNSDTTTDSMQNYYTSTFHVTSPPKDLPSNDTTSTESLALPTKENDGKVTDKSTVSYTFRSTEYTTHGKNKENSVTTETTSFHQNEFSVSPSTPSLNYPSDGANTDNGDSMTDSTENNNLSTLNSSVPSNDKSNNSSSTPESLAVSTTERVTNESTVSYTFGSTEHTTHGKNKENSVTTSFHQNELSESPSTPSLNNPSDGANTNYGDATVNSTQNHNLSTLNSTLPPKDKSTSSSTEFLGVSTTEDKITDETTILYTITTKYTPPETNEENSKTTFSQNELSMSPSTNYDAHSTNAKNNNDSTTDSTQHYNTSTFNVTFQPKHQPNNDSSTTESFALPTTVDDAKVINKSSVSHKFRSTEHTTYGSSTTAETTSVHQNELSESSTNYNSHSTDISNGSTYTQIYYPSTLNSTLPSNANYNNGSFTTESIAAPSINYSSDGVNTHNGESTVDSTQNYNTSTLNSTLPPNTNDDSFTTKSLHISTTEDIAKVTDDITVSHSFKTTKYTTQKSVENTTHLSELSPSPTPNYTSDTQNGHSTGSTGNYPQNYTFSSETNLPPSRPTQNVVTKDNICEQNEINVGTSTEVGLKNSPTTMSNTLLTLPWIDAFLLTRKTVHSCAQSKDESTIQEHDNNTESTTESTFSPDFQTSNFTTNVVTIDHTSGEFKTPITVTPVPTVLETTSPDSKEFAIGIGTATTPFSFTTTLDYSNVDYDENMAVTTTFHYDDAETTTISPTSEIAVLPWA
ncbi:mucin-3A-like [Cimex lectularius]|uniref:Chitin-binding type-2 domain-containing protein n=1 Tax=Cimex lectularius TaxID=79782 RepID=A0A8I6SJJ9_CIMLE|nr:mucin-3A-like [Cimex lectularius]XP_024082323.1 mucin-3A-like [Cimex lectularius]XP_024082324.1 mucin-3A-like [Cimex lectularius]